MTRARMRLWRGLAKRIVAVSIACGLLGLVTSRYIGLLATRDVLTKNTVPISLYLWDHYEHARCEASPATWTLAVTPGSHGFAYDAETLVSHNPAAPPLDRELLARVTAGMDPPVALEQSAAFRGGAAVYRSPGYGPCGLVMVSWTPRVSKVDALVVFMTMAVIAAAIAAAVGMFAVVRPITLRIARLRRAAERVGDPEGYAPAESGGDGSGGGDDELGELSASLDRAHGRIREDAARLERRQRDLQRHLDDVMHDLRTPIASLQLAIEQAADLAPEASSTAGSGATARELLHGALKDVVYLGGLTANLRLASQLREGWDPAARAAPVDLKAAVERVAARARIVARRGGVALDIAVPDDPVRVTCDAVAAEQAIGNVIDNAVAYGDRGGHVAVVLEREGSSFALRVEDDGPGVTPSELPRLGERTFRSDEARQRDPRGSGLGLAITSEVCARCGWQLAFEPVAPRGLRVTLRGAIA